MADLDRSVDEPGPHPSLASDAELLFSSLSSLALTPWACLETPSISSCICSRSAASSLPLVTVFDRSCRAESLPCASRIPASESLIAETSPKNCCMCLSEEAAAGAEEEEAAAAATAGSSVPSSMSGEGELVLPFPLPPPPRGGGGGAAPAPPPPLTRPRRSFIVGLGFLFSSFARIEGDKKTATGRAKS